MGEHSRPVSPAPAEEPRSPASDPGLEDCCVVWPGSAVESSFPASMDHGVKHSSLISPDCGMEHCSPGALDRGVEHSCSALPSPGMEDSCQVSLTPCMEHLSCTDHGLEPSSRGTPG